MVGCYRRFPNRNQSLGVSVLNGRGGGDKLNMRFRVLSAVVVVVVLVAGVEL